MTATSRVLLTTICVSLILSILYNGYGIYRIDSTSFRQLEIDHSYVSMVQKVDQSYGHKKGIHVVVSHCNKAIGWIWSDYLKDLEGNGNYFIRSVTILTKCGIPIPLEDLPPLEPSARPSHRPCESPPQMQGQPLVSVISLPNVGRCDHSYAYWITRILSMGSNDGEAPEGEQISLGFDHKVLYKNSNASRCDRGTDNMEESSISANTEDPFETISREIRLTDIVLFMKDNNNAYRTDIEDQVPPIDMFNTIAHERPKSKHMNNTSKHINNTTYSSLKPPPSPRGMACGSSANHKKSTRYQLRNYKWTNWAHRSILWTFHLKRYAREKYQNTTRNQNRKGNKAAEKPVHYNFRSDYRPMGAWIQHLAVSNESSLSPLNAHGDVVFTEEYSTNAVKRFNSTFEGPKFSESTNYREPDLVPMCFGGVFATIWGQLSSKDSPVTLTGWKVITHSLSRGDNLEEGHYMERWWADIMSWSSYALSLGNPSSGKNNKRNRRSGTILTAEEETSLFKQKSVHKTSPDPYTGLILLNAPKIRHKEETINNWGAIREAQKQARAKYLTEKATEKATTKAA